MKQKLVQLLLLSAISIYLYPQDSLQYSNVSTGKTVLSGFIRGGFYSWIDKNDKKIYVPSAFSDLGINLKTTPSSSFAAFGDIRFRYGTEFLKPVNRFEIREAYAVVGGKKWEMTLGQKIIKWGRCDFINPTSRLSPSNLVSRSPDRADMDLGNLLSSLNIFPWNAVNFEIVLIPYYRSSVLVIEPIPMPENVSIVQTGSLITDKKMFSYGLKTDFHLRGIDWSISWFNGYDPMPGIELTSFAIDPGQAIPSPSVGMTVKPYKNRVLGFDFETTAGVVGLRGEAAFSFPYDSYKKYEYVQLPELKWVAGFDWTSGNLIITGEYNGKYLSDFTPISANPVFGSQFDYSEIAELMSVPGFDLKEYIRQQVSAFNRLYNYQIRKFSHSACFKIESDISYGRLAPSLTGMYNFSYRDFLLIPEIKVKPTDMVTITAGAEIYSGCKGSLYRLIDDFMNGAYLSFRIDF